MQREREMRERDGEGERERWGERERERWGEIEIYWDTEVMQ